MGGNSDQCECKFGKQIRHRMRLLGQLLEMKKCRCQKAAAESPGVTGDGQQDCERHGGQHSNVREEQRGSGKKAFAFCIKDTQHIERASPLFV